MPATSIVDIGNLRLLNYDHPQHHGRNFGLDINLPNFDEIFTKRKRGKRG
jgi:hypothetical protein